MSIKKISNVEWQHEFPAGDNNDTHPIRATGEGLEINYDIISWDEIERARKIVQKNKGE